MSFSHQYDGKGEENMSSSNYRRWGTIMQNDKPVHVCLMICRHKDNRNAYNFKERRKAFLTSQTGEELSKVFDGFIAEGKSNEFCRMYLSVNARDMTKVHKELLHFLIDNSDFNLTHIDAKLAGIAAKKENAAESKWMFDFDCDDKEKLDEFCEDVLVHDLHDDKPLGLTTYPTPHGFAVVTSRGFDTRELMNKWGTLVTLKRDDLLCVDWYDPSLEDVAYWE